MARMRAELAGVVRAEIGQLEQRLVAAQKESLDAALARAEATVQARCSELAAELATKLVGALWADVSESVTAVAAESASATRKVLHGAELTLLDGCMAQLRGGGAADCFAADGYVATRSPD